LALAKAGFVLDVKPASILRPHEQTIPAHVAGLTAEIRRDGVQKDPIIIDRDSATVLDGMHRLAAFGVLGLENVVCCAVDYSSKAVTVGRWARVYEVKGDSPADVLARFEVKRRVTPAEAFSALEGRDTGLAVFASGNAYLPEGRLDLSRAAAAIRAIDRHSEARGWERRFVPEDDIDFPLQSERSLVVLMRRLSKNDVVAAATTGRLLPCKTSMHRVDPRPVAVNFPLNELNGATTASLQLLLAGTGERMLPANTMYEGRRYKERLLLLNQR